MSFFCSGLDVVYGTNLPSLVNIAIDHDFARNVSVATLYQLMGRVGREGRSYRTNIIVNSEDTVENYYVTTKILIMKMIFKNFSKCLNKCFKIFFYTLSTPVILSIIPKRKKYSTDSRTVFFFQMRTAKIISDINQSPEKI